MNVSPTSKQSGKIDINHIFVKYLKPYFIIMYNYTL